MSTNADQAEFWTGQVNWVTWQAALDAAFQPALDLVLERAALHPGQRVLDIGCGTGASVLAAAQAVGPAGLVTGVDISPTLLDAAVDRCKGLAQVNLLQADAQDIALPLHDVLISRFGVMFFANTPTAFANLANSLKPGGALVMAAWGSAHLNPWFMVPSQVAQAHLGEVPKVDRTLPGPFVFENAERVLHDLTAAGLQDIQVDEIGCSLTPAGSAKDAAELSTRIGPAASVLRQLGGTEEDRRAICKALSAEFAKFATPEGLRIPACLNLITARTTI